MSEKQLLEKYSKERAILVADLETRQQRLVALDGVISALRVVLGEVPAPPARRATKATGTKAVILDVLATAREPMRTKDLATACKVQYSGGFTTHLKELTAAGDITKVGGGPNTRYRL